MFQPKFDLSSKINTNLNEIERLYGRLEGMKIPGQLLLNLERTNLMQSVYVSNSIEGNPLTQAAVTNLILEDRIPTNRDEKEIVNYFKILKGLDQRINKPFKTSEILEIHKELMTGVNEKIKGLIRDKQVVIGIYGQGNEVIVKHNPPFHQMPLIENALSELLDWSSLTDVQPILKAGIFHHQFLYIHPFEDGNGRVCRLSTALLLLKHNYLINKYFVLDDYYDVDREAYSDSLHSADIGDKTVWLEYFTDGVKYSLQSALGRVATGMSKLTFDMRPSPKEQEALSIIQRYQQAGSSDLVKELVITRQQAFNLLKSLTQKGFLEKKGSTKGSYYLLK